MWVLYTQSLTFYIMEKKKNNLGRNSLLVAVIGLLVIQTLIYVKNFDGFWYTFLHILLAGFEAGTVGGIADWFAVRALFYEIPIPFLRKHTNIIAKNRTKMTEGIVDLVTNNWLSPQVIKEKIAGVSIVEKILSSVKINKEIIDVLKQVLSQFLIKFDNATLQKFTAKTLENQLKNIEAGAYLGKILKNAIEKKEHHQLWEIGLNSITNAVNTNETRQFVRKTVCNQVDKYKRESSLKEVLLMLGESFSVVDYDSITNKLLTIINEFIEKEKTATNGVLRKKVDESLLLYAEKLINKDEETVKAIENLKATLLTNFDINATAEKLIEYAKNEIVSGLKLGVKLDDFIENQLQKLIENVKLNKELKDKIEYWLKNKIEKLIVENHREIGKLVETSLSNLKDAELINQIESKVGNDLQYIRLNGAIVGGLVGVVIASLRFLLSIF